MDKTNTPPTPVAKQKGPLRTEAIVPIAIIALAGFLYARFFFDLHLRKGIEWTATYIHGAEVNVDAISTSFWGGSFRLSGLQITDKEQPSRNLLALEEIRFRFSWDALLRVKFLVEDAGIEGIQIYAPRKSAGWVRPPAPPDSGPSVIEKIEQNALNQAQSEFAGNVMGDIAALLEGTDEKDLLKKIQGELLADKKVKELEITLKEKEKAWKERLNNLPRKEEFEALSKRAKALKFDTKDPKQFSLDLKEASKIVKEADQKVDALKATSSDLKGDINKFNAEFKQLDDIIEKDIGDIENRLQLPDLDLQDFSKNLFGKMIAQKLGSLQKYMEIGRKYMPPPKDPNAPKDDELVPPARGAGKNVTFPITKGYPLFWLKRATISSKSSGEGFSGDIDGELSDVTSHPEVVKRPAVLNVSGDFPKAQVMNTRLMVVVDHVAEPKESLALEVGSFPVLDQQLASDSNLQLGLKTAVGSSRLNATLQNRQLAVTMNNQIHQIQYDLSAKSKVAQEAIQSILAGIPVITLNAKVGGSWEDLDIHLNSNLGEELSRGLKRYVKEKVDALKKQIRAQVEERIAGEKEKLTKEYNKLKGQVDKVLGDKKDELDKAKADVKKSTDGKKAGSKDALKKKGKELLKGLGF